MRKRKIDFSVYPFRTLSIMIGIYVYMGIHTGVGKIRFTVVVQINKTIINKL